MYTYSCYDTTDTLVSVGLVVELFITMFPSLMHIKWFVVAAFIEKDKCLTTRCCLIGCSDGRSM